MKCEKGYFWIETKYITLRLSGLRSARIQTNTAIPLQPLVRFLFSVVFPEIFGRPLSSGQTGVEEDTFICLVTEFSC